MQRNVTGFMQLSAGLNYSPFLGIDGKSLGDGGDFSVSEERISGPGYGVSFYLIPTWGQNGVHFGASYDMSALRFKQKTDDSGGLIEGDSSMGISDMVLRAGYTRYFGKWRWHPYILGDAGLSWQTARISTDYVEEDDKVEAWQIKSPVIGLGAGIAKETTSGLFGVEFRADIHPLPSEYEFPGPYDRYELEVTRPAVLKINAVFSLGHL